MRDASVPSKHRSAGQRLLKHPTGRLEARADHQQYRVRSAVPLFGAEPRGPTEQRGGRGAHKQSTTFRAKRAESDPRRLRGRYILRSLPEVIVKRNS